MLKSPAAHVLPCVFILAMLTACSGSGESTPNEMFVAFACETSQGLRQLDICVSDGKTSHRLTHSTSDDFGPVWSPDRTNIAFECKSPVGPGGEGAVVTADAVGVGGSAAFLVFRNTSGEICVVAADGNGERQLTQTGALATAPAWSPDGKRIVFARGVVKVVSSMPFNGSEIQVLSPGDVHGLFTVAPTGGTMKRLTSRAGDDLPAWSPDGRTIAFTTAKGRIAAVDADGANRRTLTSPTDALDVGPVWSPDGAWIAFTRYRLTRFQSQRTIYPGAASRETWIMRRDGSGARHLTSSPVFNETSALAFRPRWSPNGDELVTTIVRKAASWWFEIVVVPVSGGGQRRIGPITSDPNKAGTLLPSWSPDGKEISFVSDAGGDFDVYVAAEDGTNVKKLLIDPLQQYDASWTP